MVKRRKTKLERLLSFNQHKKRFGAKTLQQELKQVDFKAMKETIIPGDEIHYTYGSDKNLETHIQALRAEFSSQSELLHYHATLIVFIRREANLSDNILLFEQLWDQEADFLLEHLNTRWLIAAADTFADHSQDLEEKAYAIASSCLINTIKLTETERYLQKAEDLPDNEQRKQQLSSERVALFDGVSAIAVGTDDTLRNMRWRIDSQDSKAHSYRILQSIFSRLQEQDNLYKRFRDRHTRTKTAWW